MGIEEPTEYVRGDLDIKFFGVLNHVLGAATTDRIYDQMVAIVMRFFPTAFRMRLNGGGLRPLIPRSKFSLEKWNQMVKVINDMIHVEVVGNHFICNEVSEKLWLEREIAEIKGEDHPPVIEWEGVKAAVGNFEIITVTPEETMGQIFNKRGHAVLAAPEAPGFCLQQ